MTIYHSSIGALDCAIISDFSREATIYDAFPTTPPDDLRNALAALGLPDQIKAGGNVLAIRAGQRHILIDSGLPAARQGNLLKNMASTGIDPAKIDTLIITHGDGDHIGGLDHFPNAQLKLPQKSWNLWTSPVGQQQMVDQFTKLFGDRVSAEQVAQIGANRRRYGSETLPSLKARIDLVGEDEEILPGFRFIYASGHRSDHFAVEIESEGETWLHIADSMRHPIQAQHPGWPSNFDSFPDQLAATNTQLMARAVEKNATVFAAHLPHPALFKVEADNDGYRWVMLS